MRFDDNKVNYEHCQPFLDMPYVVHRNTVTLLSMICMNCNTEIDKMVFHNYPVVVSMDMPKRDSDGKMNDLQLSCKETLIDRSDPPGHMKSLNADGGYLR